MYLIAVYLIISTIDFRIFRISATSNILKKYHLASYDSCKTTLLLVTHGFKQGQTLGLQLSIYYKNEMKKAVNKWWILYFSS